MLDTVTYCTGGGVVGCDNDISSGRTTRKVTDTTGLEIPTLTLTTIPAQVHPATSPMTKLK